VNLRDLEYLVAVGEHGHFGRAAEACFVSQPTLSTQIRKLERELGVELVERNPRRVFLTEAGEQVAARARVMLRESEGIRAVARHAADPEGGSIRLGLFPTLGPYLLPHVVPVIHDRYPRLELLLVEEKTDEILALLRDGRLDAGVLALPLPGDDLEQRPLFEEDFVLAVPAGHRLAQEGADRADLSVLAGERLLLLEEGHCLRDQALSVCRSGGASERDGFRATSLETLRQMVAAGVGMTLLPELSTLLPVAGSSVVRLLPFTDPAPRRAIAMVWRPSNVHGQLLAGIADLIASTAAARLGHHDGDESSIAGKRRG